MDMASFNEKTAWELAKGEYQWMVAASSADVRCNSGTEGDKGTQAESA